MWKKKKQQQQEIVQEDKKSASSTHWPNHRSKRITRVRWNWKFKTIYQEEDYLESFDGLCKQSHVLLLFFLFSPTVSVFLPPHTHIHKNLLFTKMKKKTSTESVSFPPAPCQWSLSDVLIFRRSPELMTLYIIFTPSWFFFFFIFSARCSLKSSCCCCCFLSSLLGKRGPIACFISSSWFDFQLLFAFFIFFIIIILLWNQILDLIYISILYVSSPSLLTWFVLRCSL